MIPRSGQRVGGRAVEGYGLVLLAAACWAGGGLIAKWLFTPRTPDTLSWPFPPLGVEVDPVLLSGARAMTAFAMVLLYLVVRRRDLLVVKARQLPFLAAFGVFGLACMHFAYFKTISLTGVATAILLEYLAPVLVLAFSVIVLRERPTWTLPVAVALSVAGCALMVGAIGDEGLVVSPAGLAWGLASAALFAGYMLMGRYAAPQYSPWTLLAYGLAAASIFWLIVLGGPGRVIELLSDRQALVTVLVLALVSTVIPFGFFLKALHLIDATRAAITSTAEPVIAGLAAWFVFDERLSPLQLLGGALVVAAVVLSQVRTRTPPEMPVVADELLADNPQERVI